MRNGTFEGSEELISHGVFCYEVVRSCGLVATRAHDNDETCAPCDNRANEDVDLVGPFDAHGGVSSVVRMLTAFKFV